MIFDWCSSCFGWNKLEEEIEELDRPEVKLDSLNMGLGMWLRNYFSEKYYFFVKIHSKYNILEPNKTPLSLKMANVCVVLVVFYQMHQFYRIKHILKVTKSLFDLSSSWF